jgi:hypothetical protein
MPRINLSDLFGPRPPDPAAELDRRLAELERQATEAVPGAGAQFLNRAGDLCMEANRLDQGLGFFGRAIDGYLHAGRWDAAGAVCRKVLRVWPGAVRARCTLAWLSIGKGLGGDARERIREYVDAVQAAGPAEVGMARKQLALMADAIFDPKVLEVVVEQLKELGDAFGSRSAGLRLEILERGGEEVSDPDQRRRWASVLRAALMGPRELSR